MNAGRCTKQALLAEQVEELPRPYRVARANQSKHQAATIRQRVHMKRLNGQKLSTVERYLNAHHGQLQRRLFAPSMLSVCGELLAVFLRPAPILLVLGIIVASERSSSAWLSTAETDQQAIDYSQAFIPEPEAPALQQNEIKQHAPKEKEYVEFAALGAFAAGVRDALMSPPPAAVVKKVEVAKAAPAPAAKAKPAATPDRGLIEFISGVIAVYYPGETDSGKLARYIVELSRDEKVDPLYVASIIAVESRFKSHAKSSVGAMGLMQLLPSTAREVVQRQFGRNGNPALTDPRTNIKLGIRYLKGLEKRYRGNRHLALAAYNWGPANVDSGRRIPESVNKYATSILEKTSRWNRHFERAVATANEIERRGDKTV